MTSHEQLAITLKKITREMQATHLWQSSPPSSDKLQSKLPFCLDTLTFSEWLQWIMFPKLVVIIETQATLPNKSNMSTMAEEAFKTLDVNTDNLLKLLNELDDTISQP